jgi:hypothetical protein
MSCGCTPTSDRNTAQKSGERTITVDFLFLDEETCVPCGSTSDNLETALKAMELPLQEMDVTIEVNRIHVATREIAIREQFVSSPTIRVNGVDIDPSVTEGNCETCGEIAGNDTKVNCRTWEWRGEVSNAAPVAKIMSEVMNAALAGGQTSANCCASESDDKTRKAAYTIPENLTGFFNARENGCA